MKKRDTSGLVLGIIFVLLWTAFFGTVDTLHGIKIINEIRSFFFTTTTVGRITHSELIQDEDLDGDGYLYSVNLHYQYEVNGQSLIGSRYRYNKSTTSNYSQAQDVLKKYPIGSPVLVYYNPSLPSECVLVPGLKNTDIRFALFLTPFNVAMFFLWFGLIEYLMKPRISPVAGGVKIIRDGFRTKVRLAKFTPLEVGMMTLGGVTFLESFVLFIPSEFAPSLLMISSLIALIVAYGSALIVALRYALKIRSGKQDLVIDPSTGKIELLKTLGRKERRVIDISDVTTIKITIREEEGSQNGISYTYLPTIYFKGEESNGETLTEWKDEARAESFVLWLREELGLPSKGISLPR